MSPVTVDFGVSLSSPELASTVDFMLKIPG